MPFQYSEFLMFLASSDSDNQVICDVIAGAWGKKF